MKRFKEFINEGNAMDYLKPKSIEELKIALSNLSEFEKIKAIIRKKLPKELLPDNYKGIVIEEIRNIIRTKNRGSKISNFSTMLSGFDDNIDRTIKNHRLKSIDMNGLHIQPGIKMGGKMGGKMMYYKGFNSNYDIPFEDLSLCALLSINEKIVFGKTNWNYLINNYTRKYGSF